MENKNMKKNNDVEVKSNGEVLGKLPATPLDVLLNFLPVKDIAQLSGANKRLHKTIIGDPAKPLSGNPFAKERIRIAKIKLDDEAYKTLQKAAEHQTYELLRDNAVRNPNHVNVDDILVIDRCKEMWDRNFSSDFAEIIIAQRMFFDVFNMNDNSFSRDKDFPDRLNNFLDQDIVRQQMRQLLLRNYVADVDRKPCVNIFLDCLEMYFEGVTTDFGADLKNKAKIEFVKFWLHQIGDLDKKINSCRREEWFSMGYYTQCLFFCREFVEMMSFCLFDSDKDYSIAFDKFINSLCPKELEDFFFDNKYSFVTRFKDKTWDNIDLIIERILKNKSLIDKTAPINSKLKRLLCNLMTQPEFIDKLKISLPEQKNLKLSDLKITIGDGADATSESWNTFKLKLKLLDDNYRKNRCLYRMSHIAGYIDEYVIPDKLSGHIEARDYDLYKQYDEKWHNMRETNYRGISEIEKKHRDKFFIVHNFNNVTKEAFFDYAKYFLEDDDERERIKNGIYNLRTYEGRPYSTGGKLDIFNDLMTRGQYRKEQIKSKSCDKFEEDITKIKVDLDIDHSVNIDNGDEIQNVEEQEANASENEIKDKSFELGKNDEVDQNIISHEQMREPSKSEKDILDMKTATAIDSKSGVKLNKSENLVNKSDNDGADFSDIKRGEPNIEQIENNNADKDVQKDNKFEEDITKIKIDLDIDHSVNINNGDEIQNVEKKEANVSENEIEDKSVESGKNDEVDQNIISHEQMGEPSKSEKDILDMKTAADNKSSVKLNKSENLVNRSNDNKPEKTKNIMTAQNTEQKRKRKQTMQKRGFGWFLKYIFIWFGNKIKSGLRAMKNFIVSLIVRDISKSEFNKTLDVNQNESKNIGNNNSEEITVPEVASRNTDEKRNRALS